MTQRHDEGYENKLEDVIAQCDGDTRGALRALLAANEYLEAQLCSLREAMDTAPAPRRPAGVAHGRQLIRLMHCERVTHCDPWPFQEH